MALKRPLGEGGEDGFQLLNNKSKHKSVSSNLARSAILGFSSQELASSLEPQIRRWVRDEVQRVCQCLCSSSPRALESCNSTSFQLVFESKLPQMLFTGSKVESEDKRAVKLLLFDTNNNQIVSSGPLSSLKVHFVPLDGDFTADDIDWSRKDFEAKVIYARDGKRPLLAGDLVTVLKDGASDLGDVFFTDNSSWRRSRTFRLGAHAVSGVRIREAISEPFVVKDQRGESYKKHHPPALDDDIWRLEKIAKDGAFHKRLGSNRICTVKHFLQIYVTNESSLRKILGGSSNKTWDMIIKHAKDCVLDDSLYVYNCMAEGIGLLFNSIFYIVGATFDGKSYFSLDKLPGYQMALVESVKQRFYKYLDEMLPMDDLSVFGATGLTSNLFGGANIPPLHLDEAQMQLTSVPYMLGANNNSRYVTQDFSFGPYGEGCSSGSGVVQGQLAPVSNYQVGPSSWQDVVSSDSGMCFTRRGSPRGRWCMIRAAVKWVLVMRDVAAIRMEKLYPYLNRASFSGGLEMIT